MEAAARSFQAGDVIADKYELEAIVGEGGMGSVWRARHRQLESAVALKLMSPAISAQPEALSRFLREARAAARLSSLHVVKVFDFGVDAATPFIAMELLEGESLRARLTARGSLSPAATLWVIRQAGRALAKAHAEGIVHRDLKPENLFITQQEDELLKVLDFGVAKLSGSVAGVPTTSTRTGALLGTPFYMSPEQARGIKAVDHRSDIWSLAVIAFECLTGQLPFDSAAFGDLVLKICTQPVPVPSSLARVPAGFDAWFARATERDPEQRFQSVDELVEALQQALGTSSEAISAPLVPVAVANTERAPRLVHTRTDVTASQTLMAVLPSRGLGRRVALLAALAALLGAGAWLLLAPHDDGPRPRAGAPVRAKAEPSAAAAAPEPVFAAPAAAMDPPLPTPAEPPISAGPAEQPGLLVPEAPPAEAEGVGGAAATPSQPPPAAAEDSNSAHSLPSKPATLNHGRKSPLPSRAQPRSLPAEPPARAVRPDLFSDPD